MKTLLIFTLFGLFLTPAFAAKTKEKTFKLVPKESMVQFAKLSRGFESGWFKISKGEVKAAEIVMNAEGFPMIDKKHHPRVKFKLKSWTELHNFAPGSPNVIVTGTLEVNGKKHAVETKLFFEPKDEGFTLHGAIPVALQDLPSLGDAEVKIVASVSGK